MAPLWQILIASVYSRADQLDLLLRDLSQQIGLSAIASRASGGVSILVDRDDCDRPIGEKRTRLLDAATADYVCFVDDDDRVSYRYVPAIVHALDGRPDYVGFQVAYTVDGVEQKPAFHSLKFPAWYEDGCGYYRGISHLNPIRLEHARAGLPFLPGFGEDADWARRVKDTGLVRREVYVDGAPLYFYRHSTAGSLFGASGVRRLGWEPPLPPYPYVEVLPC